MTPSPMPLSRICCTCSRPVLARRVVLLLRMTCQELEQKRTCAAALPRLPAARLTQRGHCHELLFNNVVGVASLAGTTHEAAPVHHAARRRGGCVAARGPSAAAGDAGDRISRRTVL